MDTLTLPLPKHIISPISAKELLSYNIKIPSCQRSQDEERIQEIVRYQENYYNNHKCYNFIGTLTICYDNLKNFYLIDGAHRYFSIKDLLVKYPTYNFLLYITFIPVFSEDELNEYFIIINKSLPVAEYILENIQNNKQSNSKIIEETFKEFKRIFPSFFKDSTGPHIPHMNKNDFQNQLHKKDIIKLLNIKSNKHLIYLINEYNNKLSKQELNFFNKNYNGSANLAKAYEKCKKSGFFIGLLPNFLWIDFLLRDYEVSLDLFEEPSEEISNKDRPKISKTLSVQVWSKYYTLDTGSAKCPICEIHQIYQSNFECGHIISHANGGPTNLENLKPICQQCNKSMSSKNMDDFKGSLRLN